MGREITYHLDKPEYTNDRKATAGEYLRRRGFSRHVIMHLKHHENTLLLNGEPVFTNAQVSEGDDLTVVFEDEVPEKQRERVLPRAIPLDILYEDEDILVLNKPPYLPIQPSQGHWEDTLGNGVAFYYKKKGIPFVYRCVNRLDRNTSGLVVVSRHMASASVLYEEMQAREIHRTYFALVQGNLKPPLPLAREMDKEEGEEMFRYTEKLCAFPGASLSRPAYAIDLPIVRLVEGEIERGVDFDRGKRSVTTFRRISYNEKNDTTALLIRLKTGRTHQIRVHMSYLGFPIAGDELYGRPESLKLISRQALHSLSLDFAHPITGEMLHFEAPIPHDIKALMEG